MLSINYFIFNFIFTQDDLNASTDYVPGSIHLNISRTIMKIVGNDENS